MKPQSLKSSVNIARGLLLLAVLSASIVVSANTRQGPSSIKAKIPVSFAELSRDATAKWFAVASPEAATAPHTCVYINGWTLPDNPVVGQGFSLTWQGYSSGASYVMLYTKLSSESTWHACGSGGGPASGGWFSASGGFAFYASGTWQFAVASGGTSPSVVSATLVVP